ncbi:MAG TPA: hypothetical protein VGH98_09055 [Gemmatimonadaceae bacterium]|jgi:hypothetical protein
MESVRSGNDVAGISREKPNLSAEGVAVLHAALAEELADRDVTSSAALKAALSQLCDEAKAKYWPPEVLLIAFKTALETVPAVRRLTRGPDRDEFVARLVSLCIEQYFRDTSR